MCVPATYQLAVPPPLKCDLSVQCLARCIVSGNYQLIHFLMLQRNTLTISPHCSVFPRVSLAARPLAEGDAGEGRCLVPCGSPRGRGARTAVLQIPVGRRHPFSRTNGWEHWLNPSTGVGNKGAVSADGV